MNRLMSAAVVTIIYAAICIIRLQLSAGSDVREQEMHAHSVAIVFWSIIGVVAAFS